MTVYSVADVAEIAARANAERRRIYFENSWQDPGEFSRGDVTCVLDAVKSMTPNTETEKT